MHPPDDGVLPQNESSKTTGEFAACAVHFFAWLLKSRRDRWKAIVLTAQAVQKSDVHTFAATDRALAFTRNTSFSYQ